ncbi:hypothetical protein P885DRAFT_63606 [Corynascus similis CBS 632.67]
MNTKAPVNVAELPVPNSRLRPPHNSDIFLSLLSFKGAGFSSLERLVLGPLERIRKIYRQKALKAHDTHERRRRDWRNPLEVADKDPYRTLIDTAYQTAKRKKEVRVKILEVLDSLSETISHTKAEIRMYSRNQDLKEKSEALYMAILDFVRLVAAYLNKSSAAQPVKAFLQQGRYGTTLDGGADKIKEASAFFERSMSVCFQLRVQKIDKNTENLSKDLEKQLKAEMRNAGGPSMVEDLLPTFQADLQTVKGFVPSPLHENQIGLLMTDDTFTNWLNYLYALVSEVLSVPGMFTLTFFYGLHSAQGSILEGGSDLMHGAFWYGTEARQDDMSTVMLFLNRLVGEVQAVSGGLVLKVLVTNPTARQRSSWCVDQAVDIYLEQDFVAGGHGGDVARLLTAL